MAIGLRSSRRSTPRTRSQSLAQGAFILRVRSVALVLAVMLSACGGAHAADVSTSASSSTTSQSTSTSTSSTSTSTTPTTLSAPRHKPPPRLVAASMGDWLCGGDLPPCWVLHRENPNHDPLAYNGGCHAPIGYNGPPPCGGRHSTASGKWQILRSTWAMFGGFVNAADAPVEVQDARARQLWAECPRVRHWGTC